MHRYWKSVAPFVGAWIEIDMAAVIEWLDYVAPFVGAWIEIQFRITLVTKMSSRSLRGSVD